MKSMVWSVLEEKLFLLKDYMYPEIISPNQIRQLSDKYSRKASPTNIHSFGLK